MMEETLMRARVVRSGGVRPLIITGSLIADPVKKLLVGKPDCDLIVEPRGKNTAPAIALAAAWIRARYGEAIMVVLPADHLVRPSGEFRKAVRRACALADSHERLVVFGVKPSRPETGYGYIRPGRETGSRGGIKSHDVLKFIEKPGPARAAKLCASGSHLWNSGMFVWKAGVFLREVKSHMPCLYSQVLAAARAGFSQKAIFKFYDTASSESVDYGIMERSNRVSVVTGRFLWDDIGSWEAFSRLRSKNKAGTVVDGSRVFEQGCSDSIIVNRSQLALAVIGCSSAAVVATDDAVLVCPRSKLPDLKRYLAGMKSSGAFPSRLF
jgi:mannose-1-phosphate guanylyltransferase/mannose-6-phosphate isomerase